MDTFHLIMSLLGLLTFLAGVVAQGILRRNPVYVHAPQERTSW